jgi:hypothetical protein
VGVLVGEGDGRGGEGEGGSCLVQGRQSEHGGLAHSSLSLHAVAATVKRANTLGISQGGCTGAWSQLEQGRVAVGNAVHGHSSPHDRDRGPGEAMTPRHRTAREKATHLADDVHAQQCVGNALVLHWRGRTNAPYGGSRPGSRCGCVGGGGGGGGGWARANKEEGGKLASGGGTQVPSGRPLP